METTKPFFYGEAVTDGEGTIGIVTEVARKSGPRKGKVAVWWVGMPYSVTEEPEGLIRVTLTIKEEN